MCDPWKRFAGLSRLSLQRDEELEFAILGLPCTIFSDENTAQLIEDGQHLQPWQGDETATMDRFDCRLLLDSLRQLKPKGTASVNEDDELQDELWVERFGDLESAMQAEEEEARRSLEGDDGDDGEIE